jgi:DNA-binding transcriptional LysR family regulator
MTRFPLDSAQCETLVAFEMLGSVYALAEHFHKDVSVISRQLKKIASSAPVLEKQRGKWKLTPVGKQVVSWSRDSIGRLEHILQRRSTIRIGATREFASRILCPELPRFLGELLPKANISILTSETGIEDLLLSGEIDFGFDCGRPYDPLIRYKQVKKERFGVFASPEFSKRHGGKTLEALLELPALQYKRMSLARYLQLATEVDQIAGQFNDLGAMRETCKSGMGWTVLPLYIVRRELEEGSLVQLPVRVTTSDYFGIWWLRGSSSIEPLIKKAENWLRGREL